MIYWMIRLLSKTARQKHRHDQIVEHYRSLAYDIGDGLGMIHLGRVRLRLKSGMIAINDAELYHMLDAAEEEYASLGYRIIPLDRWIDHAGWGVPIDDLWLIKRECGERPRFTKFDQNSIELPTLTVN